MRFGVVVFPGSNCDADCFHVLKTVLSQPVSYIWHQDTDLRGFDCVILPGGFSYGDHLRAGAIARFSPIISEIERFAQRGGLVLGICNGFQILTEAGLLPGALLRNDCLQFRCQWVDLRIASDSTPFTSQFGLGQVLRVPIAHAEGRYYADPATVKRLWDSEQVILQYCDSEGKVCEASNPNGSIDNIAGICNEARNVFGLMPHPERCSEKELGGTAGRLMFESLVRSRA